MTDDTTMTAIAPTLPRTHADAPSEQLGRSLDAVLSQIEQVDPERLAEYERGRARDERRRYLTKSGAIQALEALDIGRIVDDRCDPTPALDIVRKWSEVLGEARKARRVPVPRVVVLLGPRGVGKTVGAAWLHAREGGLHIALDDLRRSFVSQFGPERALFRRALTVPFLTVDEPDVGVSVSDARPLLHAILHARQHGPLTLITGNLTPSDFRTRLDDRTHERLKPLAFVRELKGPSMRRALAGGGLPA